MLINEKLIGNDKCQQRTAVETNETFCCSMYPGVFLEEVRYLRGALSRSSNFNLKRGKWLSNHLRR